MKSYTSSWRPTGHGRRWGLQRLPLEADVHIILSLIFSSEELGSDLYYTQDTELVGSRFLYSWTDDFLFKKMRCGVFFFIWGRESFLQFVEWTYRRWISTEEPQICNSFTPGTVINLLFWLRPRMLASLLEILDNLSKAKPCLGYFLMGNSFQTCPILSENFSS